MTGFAVVLVATALAPFHPAPDILELHDGSRLVGELRNTATGYLLSGPLGRLEFDRGQVARIERRNDLLATFEQARAAAGTRPHALASLVAIALDRGLYGEAFDACDDAAAAGAAAETIADLQARLASEALLDGTAPALPPADDAARRKLLARVGGSSASRAAFARALFRSEEPQQHHVFLRGRLAAGTTAERRGAVLLLGEAPSERTLNQLIRASLLDRDASVRAVALEASLASNHPQLAVPYLAALDTDDSNLRTRAYPALARLRDPRAVDGLIAMLEPRQRAPGGGGGASPPRAHVFFGVQRAYVSDFDVEIAQGAVIAKPVIGILQSGVLLDVAVAGVFIIRHEERRAVLGALGKLTGQSLGDDPLAWHAWWREQGGKLPPVAAAAS